MDKVKIPITPFIIKQARSNDQRSRFGGQQVTKNRYVIKYSRRGNHQFAIALRAFENNN